MTEAGYIKEIEQRRRRNSRLRKADLPLVEDALGHFPKSARLWCLRGDLHQTSRNGVPPRGVGPAIQCYRKAVELDPGCTDAWLAIARIGSFFTKTTKPVEESIRQAIALGAGPLPYLTLAWLLELTGRKTEAVATIHFAHSLFPGNKKIIDYIDTLGAAPCKRSCPFCQEFDAPICRADWESPLS